MAANVDSPKRRSLRLQDGRVAAEEGAASNTGGSRGLAETRTSSEAEILSSERRRRIDTEVPGSKQGPVNGPLKEENDTGQGPGGTAKKGDSFSGAHMQPIVVISARCKEIDTDKSAHSMQTNASTKEDKLQPSAATNAPSLQPIVVISERCKEIDAIKREDNMDTKATKIVHSMQPTVDISADCDEIDAIKREDHIDSNATKSAHHMQPVVVISARCKENDAIKREDNRSAHSMQTKASNKEDEVQPRAATNAPSMHTETESADTSLSPGKHTRSRRNHGNRSDMQVESPISAPPNASFSRETRSSKAKDPRPSHSPDHSKNKQPRSNHGDNSKAKDPGPSHSPDHSKNKQPRSNHGDNSKAKDPGPSHSPDHSKNKQPRSNHGDNSKAKDPGPSHSPGGDHSKTSSAPPNASFTRSGKSKNPRSSPAVSGRGEGATTSSNEKKKARAHLAEPSFEKEQGSEATGGSSGHDRSLRSRRSRDGSSTVGENSFKGASATKRETRSSSGRNHEGSGASNVIRGKSAISNKENVENANVAEVETQKGEDTGGSNRSSRSRRSREGSSPKGATSSTFSRKTRASGSKVSTVGDEGDVSGKRKHENPNLAETNTRRGEGSEDPSGSSSHNRSVQPSSSTVPVETPRGATLSSSASRQTRSSRGKDHEELRDSNTVKGAVCSKEEKENVRLTEQESEGSNGDSSLLRLRSHKVSSFKGEDRCKGPSSPKRQVLATSSQKDYDEGRLFTAAKNKDSDALLGKGEGVIRPNNQSGETLEVSGGVRSLRPRRSHDGSGTSGEVNNRRDGTPSKKKRTETIMQTGEVSGVPGGHISPKRNLEDPSADNKPHPSNVNTESNAGEATRDYKVHCCSKQLLQEVLGMCTGICKEILDSQQYLNEEQKQQHHKNFVWDFESALQENVSIDGLSWHEAPDQDSEPDIKILEDQLDEAMVETSMKRKRYPRKVLSHFVKSLKTEREMLDQYKPVVNPVKVSLDPALELRMKDLSATAATVSQHIHETKKALPVQLEKAEGFSQVLSLQPVLEKSHMRNNIFYSRVVMEDISKSIPKILETTPTESEPQNLSTPVRNLRKRKSLLPQRHLYPVQSKRKISLDSS